MGCSGKTKTSVATPARYRYDRPFYHGFRAYLRKWLWPEELDVAIVSAESGFIGALTEIHDYDRRMTTNCAVELTLRLADQVCSFFRILQGFNLSRKTTEKKWWYVDAIGLPAQQRNSTVVHRHNPTERAIKGPVKAKIVVRHDQSIPQDAETRYGLDLGRALKCDDADQVLNFGLEGRTLVPHEDGNFEDWGLVFSLGHDPKPSTKQGFSLSSSQNLGGTSSDGSNALLEPDFFPDSSENGNDIAWQLEVAYGSICRRGMTGSPYA